jgi:hypothetical protein
MTTIVDGTTGITFPSTISGVSATQQYSGRVLQVVTATYSTEVSTTSSSWTATGLSASITPTSSSSKILILFNTQVQHLYTTIVPLTIFRGTISGTNLGGSTYGFGYLYNTGVGLGGTISGNYLDSPATTSAQQYTLAYASTNNSQIVYANVSGTRSSITLLEIAA